MKPPLTLSPTGTEEGQNDFGNVQESFQSQRHLFNL